MNPIEFTTIPYAVYCHSISNKCYVVFSHGGVSNAQTREHMHSTFEYRHLRFAEEGLLTIERHTVMGSVQLNVSALGCHDGVSVYDTLIKDKALKTNVQYCVSEAAHLVLYTPTEAESEYDPSVDTEWEYARQDMRFLMALKKDHDFGPRFLEEIRNIYAYTFSDDVREVALRQCMDENGISPALLVRRPYHSE